MVKESITYQCWSKAPPLQPFAKRFADTYEECQVSWNPYCIKKDALFYQFRTGYSEDLIIEVIPDACLNVLFGLDASAPYALFSGSFLSSVTLELKPGTTYFGFKPYSNLGFRSPIVSPRDMLDSYVDLTFAFPSAKRLISDLLKVESMKDRVSVLLRYAAKDIVDDGYLPTFIDYMAITICSSCGKVVFKDLYQEIGYSERYCREMFKEYYGMPPKRFSDIIRFQNTMKQLTSGSYEDLSALAVECGYFDQSHMTRDFRRYVNKPPERYIKGFYKECTL